MTFLEQAQIPNFCVNMGYYIDLFSKVEPSLYPKNKPYLVLLYDPFDMLLNLVCYYYIEDFCIYINQESWFLVLFFFFFLSVSLCDFGMSIILASENEFGSVLLNYFVRV